MCRFLAYLGPPILADQLLLKPTHSLVRQSRDAHEMESPVNGDGFGLGWYQHEVRPEPGLFRSITPAWSNENLRYNASLLRSRCVFAHIRAASEGAVTIPNCHPFHYGPYLMMHNGGVPQFGKIKRALVDRLDEDLFLWISGQTDTEHLFALLMQVVRDHPKSARGEELHAADFVECFQAVFDHVECLMREHGITKPASFNTMVTDGHRMVGTRYSTDPEHATPTLYYAFGDRFECSDDGRSRMFDDPSSTERAILVVSERLCEDCSEWHAVPANHLIAIDSDRRVRLLPMRGAVEPLFAE